MAENKRLGVGEEAPDFTLSTPEGDVTLRHATQQAERGVIVYFYPRAMTPGCTTQACDFRDNLNSFASAGYTVIGVSPDSVEKLVSFAEKYSLNYVLASDENHEVMDAWGAWGTKKNYGKEYEGVIRSTIVVGKDGRVVAAHYNVRARGHVARLRRELGIDG